MMAFRAERGTRVSDSQQFSELNNSHVNQECEISISLSNQDLTLLFSSRACVILCHQQLLKKRRCGSVKQIPHGTRSGWQVNASRPRVSVASIK